MNTQVMYQGRPLRVLQVHTLYPTFVPQYYALFPQVCQQSYTEQVQKLYEHGLHEMYIVAPLLQKMGCETQLVYSNAHHAQHAWCVENGYPVNVFSHPSWEKKILAAQVEAFKPDVLFFTDNHHFDGHFLESLSYCPRLVVGWRHAPINLNSYWHGFDILLSPSRRIRALAQHLGVKKAVPYLFGLPSSLAVSFQNVEKTRDMLFCGTYLTPFAPNCHAERRTLLDMAAHIATQEKASFDLFLTDTGDSLPKHLQTRFHPPVYGKSMYREIGKSRIGIDALGIINATKQGQPVLRLTAGDGSNMRLFEHIACGTLAFTEHRGRLAEFFSPQKELIVYESRKDFHQKLVYYLRNKEEAVAIAEQGGARLKKDYNQTKTLSHLLEIFQQGLQEKESGMSSCAQSVSLPWPTVKKMLMLLEKIPYSLESEAWELEDTLFNMACTLAVQGEYATARELDMLLNKTAFVQADMGYLAVS